MNKRQKQQPQTQFVKRANTLRKLNIGAFILHGLSFIGALIVAIIFASGSFRAQLTTDFTVYDMSAPSNFTSNLNSLGTYQLIWVELPFPFITSIFHGLIAFYPPIRTTYSKLVLTYGLNPYRWLEYSITASFMTWVILQLSGVTNVFLLIIVGIIANIALQIQGYYMELLNTPQILKKRKRINWIPTLIGWIIFLGQWSVIIAYFFAVVTSPRPPTAEEVPWFVYSIVIGLFFQFSFFGLIQLFHFLGWPRFLRSTYNTEIAFVILSFVSKFFLDWNLLLGIAINRRT